MIAATRIAGILVVAAIVIACGGTQARAGRDASGSADLGRAATLAAACTGCHSKEGKVIAGVGGRSADEIRSSLAAYKADGEGTSVMHRIARGYSEADIGLIAAYLAAREGR